MSKQRKSKHNLELLRQFAFSVNIIHMFGQQKAWAISAILTLFSNYKYPKIELRQNLILQDLRYSHFAQALPNEN